MTDTAVDRVEFVHRVWPAYPAQLAPIRAEVRRWLDALGLTDDVAEDVLLAVNEATSNVSDHAYRSTADGRTIELTFWVEAHSFSIEIVDHGTWKEPARGPTGRGRGIEMMNRLVEFVLIRYDARGTRVLLRHPTQEPAVGIG
jgi:serine/threonine-protein kinase RsbW